MTSSSIRALFLAVLAVAFAATAASAQMGAGKPIKLKAPKPQILKMKAEVIHFNSERIIVRSLENEKVVRTFTYTPKVKEQMARLVDAGGYQPGDKVVVEHEAGTDVALKVRGKPSKPL